VKSLIAVESNKDMKDYEPDKISNLWTNNGLMNHNLAAAVSEFPDIKRWAIRKNEVYISLVIHTPLSN
jgi:hypothetical protein